MRLCHTDREIIETLKHENKMSSREQKQVKYYSNKISKRHVFLDIKKIRQSHINLMRSENFFFLGGGWGGGGLVVGR